MNDTPLATITISGVNGKEVEAVLESPDFEGVLFESKLLIQIITRLKRWEFGRAECYADMDMEQVRPQIDRANAGKWFCIRMDVYPIEKSDDSA